jgi:two-component system sensor histidine kinase KdpD
MSPWISLQRADVYLEVPERDPMVLADPELTVRVLVNVLSNSLRYSPPDSTIAIRVRAQEPGEVSFSVTDQGPGVPEGWTEKVFDRFVSTKAREAGVASFGLGLAFCRLAVLAQGGRISLRNEPEGGATVTFTLPAAEPVSEPSEVL